MWGQSVMDASVHHECCVIVVFRVLCDKVEIVFVLKAFG